MVRSIDEAPRGFKGPGYEKVHTTLLDREVASSSSSERNSSTYSIIHSIKCNRLPSKKVEDLLYMHSNLRPKTHKDNAYKKGEAKHWEVELERTELEDSIARLDALAVDDDDHKLPSDTKAARG